MIFQSFLKNAENFNFRLPSILSIAELLRLLDGFVFCAVDSGHVGVDHRNKLARFRFDAVRADGVGMTH